MHLIDLSSASHDDILKDYRMLRHEMAEYSPELMAKPHMVLFSKMDLYDPELMDLAPLRSALEVEGVTALPISAETGEGLDALTDIIFKKYRTLDKTDENNRPISPSSQEAQIERKEI